MEETGDTNAPIWRLISASSKAVPLIFAVLGFIAGLFLAEARARRRREAESTERGKRNGVVCECGAIIQGKCTPEEIARHRMSNRHARNMLRHSAKEVVACEEVSEYRAAALALVTSSDLVLEVGSHVGGTTKFLAGVAGRVVGLDQQPELVAQARQKYPDIQFENFDAFDASKLLALAKQFEPERFSKVFIDISGSRDLSTVIRLMDIFDNTLKPDVMVVKSQLLKKMLLRSRNWIHHPAQTATSLV
ncbi:unnamed protein product [Polarella glacialis]|uniref:Methyltransferase domain-containing protein n=1 Tax=Polarella glacialis TaxID=89957 RepID=A0A813DVW7_POLGL|nr:unnamed protein product [Polarella glacialis]CAE8624645.1 unnamed protein product [Polarella glacialis]CAE8643527.1 unnamed protein product [Polarella glacialis]CAE8656192.1 unnamed protein product [Polarella glacialis]|mmetsp:Transcript_75439/g.121793  ORF Transcript_75439/g.121793 Transcript_75439/m.121793 type:complete len:248 (-) Transcript_75439:57-800(-)